MAAGKFPLRRMERVLFLDVDGVCHPFNSDGQMFRDTAMCALQSIVSASGAVIVLSSSWQTVDEARELVDQALVRHGIPPCVCTTMQGKRKTGTEPRQRAREISSWLESHTGVESWVALDDMELPLAPDHFVRTQPDVGLTAEDASRAIAILTGHPD